MMREGKGFACQDPDCLNHLVVVYPDNVLHLPSPIQMLPIQEFYYDEPCPDNYGKHEFDYKGVCIYCSSHGAPINPPAA